jgi:hypothetical protein
VREVEVLRREFIRSILDCGVALLAAYLRANTLRGRKGVCWLRRARRVRRGIATLCCCWDEKYTSWSLRFEVDRRHEVSHVRGCALFALEFQADCCWESTG